MQGNGLAMRAGLFLAGLARSRSVRVLVAPVFGETPAPDDFVRRHAADFAVLELAPLPDPLTEFSARLATPARRRRALALHPMPSLCRWATPAAAEAVAAAADGCGVVHTMRLYLAPLLDGLLDRPGRPTLVLDLDDVESTVNRRLGRLGEAERYERLEAYYLPRFDRVITCSRRDARSVASRYGLAVVTPVPNAARLPDAPSSPTGRHDLLFVGNLSYPPNVDAACWLCQEVVPLLDGATVALVGSRPAPAVRALADGRRVTVAADVPDVGPWYMGASVAVVPLHAGGGTRTKVLEAFAHRRPVVATTVGAEGLDIRGADAAILLADTPQDFATACRRLLDDPRLAARLASRGEVVVRNSATVEVVGESIDRLFGNILGT
jgi:glycosyltransferase involved in cell wall biosynthesis